MKAWIVVCAALSVSSAAQARMYQWISPTTGTAQFSGTPPSWYRTERPGPRILVFEGGALVDDTALALSAERQEELRAQAYEEVERRRDQALKRLQEAAQRKADAAKPKAQPADRAAEAATAGPDAEQASKGLVANTIDAWKAIIAEFDRRGGVAGLSQGSDTGADVPPSAPR